MEPPTTYHEWVAALKSLKEGDTDEETVSAILGGTLPNEPEVSSKVVGRLVDAVDYRMLHAVMDMEDTMTRFGQEEIVLIRSLDRMADVVSMLHAIAMTPALPEIHRKGISERIRKQADVLQASLEDPRNTSPGVADLAKRHPVNGWSD